MALPPDARPGRFWRLFLSALPPIQHTLGNTCSTGNAPLPVISMPVRIIAKPEKSPAERTQIERMYHASLVDLGDLHFLLR